MNIDAPSSLLTVHRQPCHATVPVEVCECPEEPWGYVDRTNPQSRRQEKQKHMSWTDDLLGLWSVRAQEEQGLIWSQSKTGTWIFAITSAEEGQDLAGPMLWLKLPLGPCISPLWTGQVELVQDDEWRNSTHNFDSGTNILMRGWTKTRAPSRPLMSFFALLFKPVNGRNSSWNRSRLWFTLMHQSTTLVKRNKLLDWASGQGALSMFAELFSAGTARTGS